MLLFGLDDERRQARIAMTLRVVLVDESPERSAVLQRALREAGYETVAQVAADMRLPERIRSLRPDVIVIDMESPDRDTLEQLCCARGDEPRPVVLFTHDGDADKIRAAIRAGVSAYVVGGLSSERVKPIIDVAIARFEEHQALKRELDRANATLAERKRVERAKGILMRSRDCGEAEAYQAMRKMAMDRNLRLADVADNIIAVAGLMDS